MGITAEATAVIEQRIQVRASGTILEGAHHPDGLTLAQINALIGQVYREIGASPVVVTAGLTDGSAGERKRQRIEQRATNAKQAEGCPCEAA